jgi:DNA polymerase
MTGDRALGPTFDIENIGWIDFESRNPTTDIRTGAYRYAGGASAIILAWSIGTGAVNKFAVGDFKQSLSWLSVPVEVKRHHARVVKGEAIWAAWNAGFDKAIWNHATRGFPELAAEHIIDVMAQASAAGLPPDLAMASRIAGAGKKKDPRGKKLIELFCDVGATATPESHPTAWKAFLAYAGDDIEAMRAVFLHTRQLSLAEWQEYWAMERVNERGVGIDRAMAIYASAIATEDKERARQDIFSTTRGEVPSVDHVKLMTEWLVRNLPEEGKRILLKREEEIGDDGEVTRPAKYHLTRRQIERLLAYCKAYLAEPPLDDVPNQLLAVIRAEKILQIRLYGGSKTPAKFAKMLEQAVEGTLFGQYVFNGASQTGRASSRGVQIHNLSRDTLEYEHEAIEAILGGCDHRGLAAVGDATPVSRKLALLIRPAFIPADGNVFVWSDWSQIEARILPWLAGEASAGALDRLHVFRSVDADPRVPDIYTRTASVLSHIPLEQITKPIRQRGKVAELALGFGGGVGSLQSMAAAYGLHIPEREARENVERWRQANRWCVDFWAALWDAINRALAEPRVSQRAGRITYVYLPDYLGGSLLCKLPSGRCLTYRNIRREVVDEEDDDGNVVGRSVQLRFARGYGRVKFWHGMACENVVQAVAADCLRGTLVRLRSYQVRLHTHDEILLETLDGAGKQTALELRLVMQHGFDWSFGLPLMSHETIAPYYTKRED